MQISCMLIAFQIQHPAMGLHPPCSGVLHRLQLPPLLRVGDGDQDGRATLFHSDDGGRAARRGWVRRRGRQVRLER